MALGRGKTKVDVVKADILVLGGGIVGCFASIKAKESELEVLLVDKGNIGRSCMSHQMSGVISYFDPADNDYEAWSREWEFAWTIMDGQPLH